MMRLSIVMPVLNEGDGLVAALDALADLRALGVELIVVDGGSRDATVQRARLRADRVLTAPRGRALQMNAGAEKAAGDVLLFLPADTRLTPAAEPVILNGLAHTRRACGSPISSVPIRHGWRSITAMAKEPVAIAVLAKAPVPGFAKTRLIPVLGADAAAAFAARLIERAVATACEAATGPVTLWATPD